MSDERVAAHYGRTDLGERLQGALAAAGLEHETLTPSDLAPLDEFHVRGREATAELAALARLRPGERVIDVGAGLGGPARHLAREHGVHVVGVDLTPEYCEAATMLTERAGLAEQVEFRCGDALDLPAGDGEFDVVWTQHAAMNVAARERLYRELRRVVHEQGRLALYDVVAGGGGSVHFPVPWARTAEISHLVTPDELRRLLERSGFEIEAWHDVTAPAAAWFRERLAAVETGTAPALGLHVLLGEDARPMFTNMLRNLEERRIGLLQAVATAARPWTPSPPAAGRA